MREADLEIKKWKVPQSGTMWQDVEKCTPLWREARLEVYIMLNLKPEIFKKVPAVVARSTFRSQTGQRWTKHTAFGTLLEVEIDMFRHCTPLCREAH